MMRKYKHASSSELHDILVAFNVLSCFAIVLLILVLLPPLLSKSVHRRHPWYSHMLSWLVVTIAFLLLIGHQRDRSPPPGLCFVQSALLYGTPPLIASSMACHLLDINLAITSLLNKRTIRKSKKGMSIFLALVPWIIFWAVVIEVSIVYATASSTFKPSGNHDLHLFCHYNSRLTNIISATLAGIASLILLGVKVWTIVLLIRKFKTYEWTSVKISQMVLSAFIRTVVFSVIALVGVIVGQISYTYKTHDAPWSLVWPLLPITAALVYGVHADVIRWFAFWRKKPDLDGVDGVVPDPPRDEEETMVQETWRKYGSGTGSTQPDAEKPLPPIPAEAAT